MAVFFFLAVVFAKRVPFDYGLAVSNSGLGLVLLGFTENARGNRYDKHSLVDVMYSTVENAKRILTTGLPL